MMIRTEHIRTEHIRIEKQDGATVVWLDRPERRNALTGGMNRALGEAVAVAGADPDCRCVVIRGTGDHFCAGRDLEQAARQEGLEGIVADSAEYTAIYEALHRLSKPSVAVVRGYAVAGGFTLAMGCDFVLADTTARFGALEMRGGFPAAVNTAILTHLAGPRRALELLLSQEVFPAEDLHAMGLLNRLAEDTKSLETMAEAFVKGLVALDPLAVRMTKEMHRAAKGMALDDALVMAGQLNALLVAGGKFGEGAAKFAGRKK